MTNPIIVSYYTLNTPYEQIIINLRNSLNKFNLSHDLRGVPDLGSWEANTHFKATFLKSIMVVYPNAPLLYVDADAVFNSIPVDLFNIKCDIGVRYQDFPWRKHECLSGTILLHHTPNTYKLIEKWIEINSQIGGQPGEKPDELEQRNLDRAIKQIPDLIVFQLPPEYVFIFDHMKKLYPNTKPIIEHFQASRKYRHKNYKQN